MGFKMPNKQDQDRARETNRQNSRGGLSAGEQAHGHHRFEPWGINNLLKSDLTYSWMARGMVLAGTYGQDAGELKTLKSYLGMARQIGLAAAVPILGHWKVEHRTRVLVYVAEGGRISWTRRLVRMCEAHGVDVSDLEGWLVPIFDAAPMDTKPFRDSLRGQLAEYRPGFVHLDPLYPFQPLTVSSSQYVQVGAMLTELQLECAEHDAVLWITAHMNQTGSGFDLKRISGAGIGEWGDSWTLTKHREAPQVADGVFKLAVEIGSRQWGGSSHHIDFHIGKFDIETGNHDGPIKFTVNDSVAGESERATKDSEKRFDARRAILAVARKARAPLTKTEFRDRSTGASNTYLVAAFSDLIDDGTLVEDGSKKASNNHEHPTYKLSQEWTDAP